ncbi:radial spokehead family protein [Cyclospora cayetanensis]|uniref:Radial spokehead family protein n=1 Tax=Cyclospora cayetanensis TaxID=88456 RepID=A0A1D3CWU0_9EIME|nr:radial spokehead family protein [Cyclospora cayetanensis]
MTTPTTVEQVQCLLQKCGASGHNIYDHLSDVVAALVAEQPDDPYEAFERVSESVKALKALQPPANRVTHPLPNSNKEMSSALHEWLKATKRLVQAADPENEVHIAAECPDFLEVNRLLNWAGCGFTASEAFRICCALKRLLASSPGIVSARFWGKVLGIKKDYIIAETRYEGEENMTADQETEEAMDRRGTGSNTYTYFVMHSDGYKWVLLPDVLPSHIATARKIKKLFTGDLDRQIVSFPWFPGREKHLLRATIAIISADTVLCPAGLLQISDEAGDPEEDPEFEFPSAKALASTSAWTHSRPYLTTEGLTVYPDLDEKDERYPALQHQMEEDPILELTRPASEDPNLPDGRQAWNVRLVGDNASYKEASHSTVVLRSNAWPGAVTVCYNKLFASVYCGWGLKHGGHPFFPIAPNDVQLDPPDLEEQPEPQPGDDELSDGASQEVDCSVVRISKIPIG